jgi:hypothetical protein
MQIGWQQIFLGISSKWERIQDTYYWHHRDEWLHSKMTGYTKQVKLIRRIWDRWSDLWKLQNQAVQGHDCRSRQIAEQRERYRSLAEIYNNQHNLEPSVQQLLLPTEVDHQQIPLRTTWNWIATNRRISHDSMRRVKTMALQGVRSTSTYFHSMPTKTKI